MRVTVFRANKGDCLMVEGAAGGRLLVDGGLRGSFKDHVAPALAELGAAGERIDRVCVTHLDEDHIAGVLQLFDDDLDWRVFDYHLAAGNVAAKPPGRQRPPKVGGIWHNAFHTQVGSNAGAIADLLAASAAVLAAGDDADLLRHAERHRELASSIPQAIQLSRRIGSEQLGVPLNEDFAGKLAVVRDDATTLTFGSLEVALLAPFEADLADLRDDWNTWLEENEAKLADIEAQAKRDAQELAASEVDQLRMFMARQARPLAAAMEELSAGLASAALGERKKVTTPNLASIMLHVEDGGAVVLLTGDGHSDEVERGLEHTGKLEAGEGLHVELLKVPHHGAEFNMRPEFARRVTADHYVFCGNGAHHNPDKRVVELVIESRLGPVAKRADTPGVDRPFKLWFNSHPDVLTSARRKSHMTTIKELVDGQVAASGGRMTAKFLADDFVAINL